MRYVQKAVPVQLIDPITGDLTEHTISFEQALQTAVMSAVSKQSADALALISLRQRFASAKDLEYVPVEEETEYAAILPEFKRPTAFNPAYVLSAETHIRAWVDAPTKAPVEVKAS